MAAKIADDATLDEIRAGLAAELPMNAAFDGWNDTALAAAAQAAGIDLDVAKLAFPGGAVDMIDAWFAHVDAEMATALPPEKLSAMKIRERITALVEQRLATLAGEREALRRALAVLAMPQNALKAARLGWRSADRMWRLAGDTATDYNHYTKRAMLAGIYGATITVFLDDETPEWADTRAFLSRRIDGIMRFEKAKAKLTGRMGSENRLSLSRFIGRLRYPAT
ncbi:COQ9 family protein [Stakelama sp. CBK3Z-3]|uniref:COQ9 family protein n=1 Tax=Stakelama flava TaxID=2860338 RepID=A0ABS6XIS7_9SPHN|nr:COQ9 family protein [Stakelama flava]MBW4330100.1 COQ9 family protein [Stakelama flava]